jgi:hypothetical protein
MVLAVYLLNLERCSQIHSLVELSNIRAATI